MVSATARRLRARARTAQGFSVIELLMVIAIIGVLAAVAIGVTPGIVQTAKGQAGAQQLAAFLKRHRELAISRRRNIEIQFTAPNQVQSRQRAVPDPAVVPTPAPALLETIFLEGRLEFRRFGAVPDTPDLFGNGFDVVLGGAAPNAANPVLFTSEGQFTDSDGDPVNASIFLGVVNQRQTANALTILGTTAAIRTWRYDGSRWVQ